MEYAKISIGNDLNWNMPLCDIISSCYSFSLLFILYSLMFICTMPAGKVAMTGDNRWQKYFAHKTIIILTKHTEAFIFNKHTLLTGGLWCSIVLLIAKLKLTFKAIFCITIRKLECSSHLCRNQDMKTTSWLLPCLNFFFVVSLCPGKALTLTALILIKFSLV